MTGATTPPPPPRPLAEGLTNLEGITDFDITWPWRSGPMRRGATAVLRVKNEAPSLPFVLPPLLRACDEVLLVDNGSDDGTPEVSVETAERIGLGEKLRVLHYPFAVAPAGTDHLQVHERSVHSLAYFYNWCFAQVHTRYSWKWDGDMVLTREGEISMAGMSWQINGTEAVVRIPRHPLYVEGDRRAFLDLGLRNLEAWGYPMGPEYLYTKAFEWEIRMVPDNVPTIRWPNGLCVEVKHLAEDEFDHWSAPEAFSVSNRNKRKRREWEVFNALAEGIVPAGVVVIDAPAGVHVIDHVTQDWLPSLPRPIQTSNYPSKIEPYRAMFDDAR
ncbi:hypothetical protein [Nocardioides panacisoli]|uniref:Glycosyltransferase family 2 protein n=1 Tax=Nocardioides panacisoli TaxID=627624 RepID=A0ABP7HZX3_9ACTN